MKFRPLLQTSSNVQTIYGRRQLRSSAAFHSYLTKKIAGSGALSYSQEGLPLVELQATERKFTTSPVNALLPPTTFATLWCAGTQSPQDMENALLMFSRECSGPH
jgi:hypothetical protein